MHNATWTHGYVTEVEYTRHFYRELAPSFLRYALTLGGFRTPAPDSSFTYCELGCGHGASTTVLAAANPHGKFWGVDFNPQHVAGARELAGRTSLGNVTFLDSSFEEFLEVDTPPFDFIGLHGVYSWISLENRRTIVELIRAKLKPGGIAYVSYNALPGWAPLAPFRDLATLYGQRVSGPATKRIEEVFAFMQKMANLNAAYFASNPLVKAHFEQVKTQDKKYLAHEYLNRDWHPQYAHEVAAEMAEGKLEYATSADLQDHFDTIHLNDEARALLDGLPDPVIARTVRDYILGIRFRKDIFIKGGLRLAAREQRAEIGRTRFALVVPAEGIELKARVHRGEANLKEEIYRPIIEALAKKPATIDELGKLPALADLGPGPLVQAVSMLVHIAAASPCARAVDPQVRAHASGYDNALIQGLVSDTRIPLASPLTGSGIFASGLDLLFARARLLKRDPRELVTSFLAETGQSVLKDGKPVESPEEQKAEIARLLARFEEHVVPLWRQHGIL
jgi:SAM-dependent methyltransferase